MPPQPRLLAAPKPSVKPARPEFSSGPCAKRPGWTAEALDAAPCSAARTARKAGKARLKRRHRPHRARCSAARRLPLGIVPASDTGAFEMAMWSMLGARRVDVLAWESFGKDWVTDVDQAAQARRRARADAPTTASCPTSSQVDRDADVCLHLERHHLGRARARTATGSPPTARASRSATPPRPCSRRTCRGPSSMSSPSPGRRRWAARRAHGMLSSRRAPSRGSRATRRRAAAEDLPPDQGRQAHRGHLRGRDHQHAVDAVRGGRLDALDWAEAIGGLAALRPAPTPTPRRSSAWVDRTPWVEFLAADPADALEHLGVPEARRPAVAGRRRGRPARLRQEDGRAPREGRRRLDIAGYRDAPPGLRIWCGATVETADLEALMPWLDWAFATAPPPDAACPAFATASAAAPRQPRAHRPEDSPECGRSTMPRVLIADELSPAAVEIFKERGVDADFKTGSARTDEARRDHRRLRRPRHPLGDQGHRRRHRRRQQPARSSAAPASASTTSTSRPPPPRASW